MSLAKQAVNSALPSGSGVTKVLIVDDSITIRKLLTDILSQDPSLKVVGAVPDPFAARDSIKLLKPDVITLDVEMPKMDGISFLRNLMRLRPMPVVMISTLTHAGSDTTLEALSLGAVDFIGKPSGINDLSLYADEVRRKVRSAGRANIAALDRHTASRSTPASSAAPLTRASSFTDRSKIIAIGSSTGGTEAVKDVLSQMNVDLPGVVITQHIPASFSGSFARRLNDICAMSVKEAEDGDRIMPGHVYIAPGHSHLEIIPDREGYMCRLSDADPVNHHRPSVEVLFESVKKYAGRNAIGVMLTGMGDDGSKAMLEMNKAGSFTIAQDEKTSVVWGMPGAAVRLGAADEVLPLNDIASRLMVKVKG